MANVTILYNSKIAQSLLVTMILAVYHRNDTISKINLAGLDETDMDTAIDTVTDGTQDAVYLTCPSSASYSTPGVPSDDVNIATATGKIDSEAEAPYNAVIDYGDADTGKSPAQIAWTALWSKASSPKIVQLLGGNMFPVQGELTATSVAAGSISDTGQFTIDAMIGYYVAITSASTGAGQIRKITDNTANTLTIERNWDITPTGTVKYAIYEYEGDALKDFTIPLAIYAEMHDLTNVGVIAKYYKMLDLGLYDTKVVPFVAANGLSVPNQDRTIIDELHQIGLYILHYNSR